jgi:hypothetical protein
MTLLFPGSTVATSLCDGEAVDKHVAILSIYKKHFRITPVRLKTVRPFVFDTIVLADCRIDFSTEKPSEEVSWCLCSAVGQSDADNDEGHDHPKQCLG